MKWNTEWVDLQNIEHMVAECWRMGGHQLEKYVQKLSKQQDLIFAGELGIRFLELLRKSVEEERPPDWAKLQKDIHLMQELIQDGQAQHDMYWKSQYQELSAAPAAYFGTEFGKAFTDQIGAKLELNISEEQRMLQHDIRKIQKICSTCNWDDEEKAKKALLLLTRDEKYYFSSWLGDAFINVLQERYGKKEAEEESEFIIQPEAEAVKKSTLRAKIVWTIVICVSVGLIGCLLYLQSDESMGREKLQKLLSDVMSAVNMDKTDALPLSSDGQDHRTLASFDGNKDEIQASAGKNDAQTILADGQNDVESVSNGQESGSSSDGRKSEESSGGQKSGFPLGRKNKKSSGDKNNGTRHIPDANTADTGTEQEHTVPVADILPQYRDFHQNYPDLFGWLKIPGMEIDQPVMQSDDAVRGERYFYLHRDHTGRQSEAGSLFVEGASSCFPQDHNTVIYGHNMSSGQGFGMLEQYKNPQFYRSHPLIKYDTIYETGTYQIVAVLITRILYQDEEGFRYYRFYNYHSKEEFSECADFVTENQLYDTGERLQYGDQLLMLSTCEYSKPNGRLVIVAKRTG